MVSKSAECKKKLVLFIAPQFGHSFLINIHMRCTGPNYSVTWLISYQYHVFKNLFKDTLTKGLKIGKLFRLSNSLMCQYKMQSIVILCPISAYKIRNVFIHWSSSLLFGVQMKEMNIWQLSICGSNSRCANCILHVAKSVFWISCSLLHWALSAV